MHRFSDGIRRQMDFHMVILLYMFMVFQELRRAKNVFELCVPFVYLYVVCYNTRVANSDRSCPQKNLRIKICSFDSIEKSGYVEKSQPVDRQHKHLKIKIKMWIIFDFQKKNNLSASFLTKKLHFLKKKTRKNSKRKK